MAQLSTRVYVDGVLAAENFPLEAVSGHLADPKAVIWVDLGGPTLDELHVLADELGLHELAVEDAIAPHQRPKVDYYDTHFFLSCHALHLDAGAGQLRVDEIDVFANHRWLITVHRHAGAVMEQVQRRWDRSPHLSGHGAGYLLWGLLDVVVDGYFEVVDDFDEYYDDISERLFSDNPLDVARERHWFAMRRSLVRFHRLAVPLREAVSTLLRRDRHAVNDDLYPYFQDVYDHILRVSESTDVLRELTATIVETNLSLRDYRQNQVMKKVTSWAAIVAVPTLVTGWYGMNLPFPGFGSSSGVATAAGLIVTLSTSLFVVFRRQEWL